MLYFLISALRAIVEMLGLCILAQGLLYILAGSNRLKNPIYQIFALIARGPQQCLARFLPRHTGAAALGFLTFLLLLLVWLGLAVMRKLL